MPEPADTETGGVSIVLGSLSDAERAGQMLEHEAKALKTVLEDPQMQSLIKAHDKLEKDRIHASGTDTVKLLEEVVKELSPSKDSNDSVAELVKLLDDIHVKSLVDAHDGIARKVYVEEEPLTTIKTNVNGIPSGEPIRMVGLHKSPREPLGVTFKMEGEDLVIARIMCGSMIERQGLLHVGDIITEINGQNVVNMDPEKIQEILKSTTGKMTLKVIPSYQEGPAASQVFMKSYIDYDPSKDGVHPCPEAGLSFKKGDILQILSQDDVNYWQAKHLESDKVGLIPSQVLEEKRRSFVKHQEHNRPGIFSCGAKKGEKIMYQSQNFSDFDRHEVMIYEEVAHMPPFQRKTLVLIGAPGVGRRTLKNRLILSNPDSYSTPVAYTSRAPREGEVSGKGYFFASRKDMEGDIRNHKFLEHGEYQSNIYGTKIESIRNIIKEGKISVLDVNPAALKVLKSAEFMPMVVFIGAPGLDTMRDIHSQAVQEGTNTIKRATDKNMKGTVRESEKLYTEYSHFFDKVIINNNMDQAFDELQESIKEFSSQPQWVPVSWVF